MNKLSHKTKGVRQSFFHTPTSPWRYPAMSDPSSTSKSIINPSLLLTDNEQALLQAALSSNTSPSQPISNPSIPRSGSDGTRTQQGASTSSHREVLGNMGSFSTDMYRSPEQATPNSGQFDDLEADTSPLLDFDLEDGNFEWDNTGMIGDLPEMSNGDDSGHHDKRKKSQDEEGGDEGSAKRREGEDKSSARKPGRKPLTGEPTTVSSFPTSNYCDLY